MSSEDSRQSNETSSELPSAVDEQVREFLRRRTAGERLDSDAFLRSCADPSDELRQALRRAELVSQASGAAESDRFLEAIQRMSQDPLDDEEADDGEDIPDIRMTMVESPADIRTTQVLSPFDTPAPDEPAPDESRPLALRPIARPPTPVLKVFDDNQTTGELIRIRTSPFQIGRTEGDLIIPHDSHMSDAHATIHWTMKEGNYRWHLTHLGGEHSTFVKAQYSRLNHGKHIRVGRHLFRFEDSAQPALVDMTSGEPTDVVFLTEGEHWLGRDPTICPSFLLRDATLDRKHALVYNRGGGRWWAKSLGAHNGLWIEVDRAELQPNCSFLLGEQRFAFLLT